MEKEDKVMAGFWDMFNKRMWLDSVKMKASLAEYKPSEIHCIEYIANNPNANVTRLADAFFMTRSAISKLTRKLIQKGVAESYQKQDNKKEIYFTLTQKGREVNAVHEKLHEEYRKRDAAVFAQISDKDYDAMLRFAQLYNAHLDAEMEKLGVNIKASDFDTL